MKWEIDVSQLPLFLKVVATGSLDQETYLGMWKKLLASEPWRPGLSLLIDLREVSITVTHEAYPFKEVIDFLIENGERFGHAKIARIVNERDLQNARAFQYAMRLRGSRLDFQVFLHETDAANWIWYHQLIAKEASN